MSSKAKRLLILSFYYQPDLCAGSFRATAFVRALQEKYGDNIVIEVLTTMPNRYQSFEQDALPIEAVGNVIIYRFPLGHHKSGLIDQSLCFFSFGRQVLKHTFNNDYDLVFATSSRLMTAFLGSLVSRIKFIPLYLDIRDIFTDTMDGLLGNKFRIFLLPVFRYIEKTTIQRAVHVNLVSEGFRGYFEQYVPDSKLSFFTNGIDDDFLGLSELAPVDKQRKVILYAGNLGMGQGMHLILPQAAELLPDYDFKVIGDGGASQLLEDSCAGALNIELLNPMSRNELIKHYQTADILFMHLNDVSAFEKVLPSKVFEYAALGKPIVAGVAGYAKEFINEFVSNAEVFEPCNALGMKEAVVKLDLNFSDRKDFIAQFKRVTIMRSLVEDLDIFLFGEQK